MASAVSPSHQRGRSNEQQRNEHELRQQIARLEKQVFDLDKEVVKQKELRMLYRKRAERTQDYLKHCLQIAQDHGFLHIIMNQKHNSNHHYEPQGNLSSPINDTSFSPQGPTTTPEMQATVNRHSNIELVRIQARVNGWLIEDTHEVHIKEKIAEGSTSDIFKATWRGLDVAVKCISLAFFNSNPNAASFFAQELDTLSRQRHRFVLHLMAASIHPPDHAWLVTELLTTTLKDWLHGPGNGRRVRDGTAPLPPLEERLAKAVEISQAMQYLHEQKPMVIHRDLKPSNVFLDDGMHVRVADFGHARLLGDEERALTGEIGTYVYMAPEVIRFEPYNEKCDVYSFGVILNELITGDHPFIEKTDYGPSKIGMEVAEGKLRPALPDDKDGQLEELIDLICLSWDQNPSLRPSFCEITIRIRNLQKRLALQEMSD